MESELPDFDPSSVLAIDESDRVKLTVRDLVVSLCPSTGGGTMDRISSVFKGRRKNDTDLSADEEKLPKARIIDGVNLDVQPGQVLAILGGSGSGKTTLLNTISHRVTGNKQFSFTGMVKYNEFTDIEAVRHSYLLQDDAFLPHLTVRETLEFVADLKLPSTTSKSEKRLLIDSILQQLGIERISHSMISTGSGSINLSGGERRLVSLAMQLLNKPSLLFLDEPTTGLDANSSIRLMTVLHQLAQKFKIAVMLTIHQPRYEILEMIDKISILAKGGRLVYYGSVQDSIPYFDDLGFPIEENVNLADFLIDLSMKDIHSPELELESSKRVAKLVDHWDTIKYHSLTEEAVVDSFSASRVTSSRNSKRISYAREIAILTKRTFVTTLRDKFSLYMLDVGIVIVSIALGWMFVKPKHDLSGIRTIQSQLYVQLETLGFVPLFYELSRLWSSDGKHFLRERSEGMVSITGWLASRRLAKFVLEDFPISLVFSLITYFMWGLRLGASYFLIYFAVALLVNITGLTCATLCFALGNDFSTSGLITNLFYQLQNNGCGFFVNAKTMPVYVRWVKYIAYFWYGFGALASNQFTDWMGDCDGDADECLEYSGEYVLETLGYPEDWIALPICVMLCWAIAFYVAAGLILHYKSTETSMSKPKVNRYLTKDNANGNNKKAEQEAPLDKVEQSLLVDVSLVDIELWVAPKKFDFGLLTIIYEWARRKYFPSRGESEQNSKGKKLLNGVSAQFSARKVNAILGPSGSGKTTLLNHLAGTLPEKKSNFTTRGEILLNGTRLPRGQKSLGKLCSYVKQMDTHLIPTLTVRETLYFQAKVRLPGLASKDPAALNQKVDEMITKMSLRDCENILIGSDLNKGLSGGEKKRVSIAIQLLDDSKILLLDEPTSGLDSFTATQILKLLNELAEEYDKTIILTIHQPKLELFQQFGKILLLSRGGNVVYNDSTQGLSSYVSEVGYPCPKLTNIADHALDLMSHNLGEDLQTSQKRIEMFTSEFKNRYTSRPGLQPAGDTDAALVAAISTKRRRSFKDSFFTLARRQMLTMIRDPNVIFCRVIQVVGVAILQALFFSPIPDSTDGISNRLGVIQETMNMFYIGFVNNIVLFPVELSYFYTDYNDGVIGLEAFFVSYLCIELPIEIAGCLVFSALVSIPTDLSRTPEMFFMMFFVALITVNTGESLGIMLLTVFENVEVAINVLANLLIIGIFMAGTMSLQLPSFFKAWNYLSPLKYGVGVIAKLGFEGRKFECEIGDSCTLNSGAAVLEYYGLDCDFAVYSIVLACIGVIYRVIAYLLLCIKTKMK